MAIVLAYSAVLVHSARGSGRVCVAGQFVGRILIIIDIQHDSDTVERRISK